MNTTYVIVFVAMASVLAMGAITVNSSMVSLATGSAYSESGSILGHVEYTLYDSNGDIKAYHQLDNIVVNTGDDCTAEALFGGGDRCTTFARGGDVFTFIGIGNATHTIVDGTTALFTDGATNTVAQGAGSVGLMAIKQDSDAATEASTGSGAVTVISTETAFTFKADSGNADDNNNTNATVVRHAGLFDSDCARSATSSGQCTSYTTADLNLFAGQNILVTVGEGDSLDVTWTITTGG